MIDPSALGDRAGTYDCHNQKVIVKGGSVVSIDWAIGVLKRQKCDRIWGNVILSRLLWNTAKKD